MNLYINNTNKINGILDILGTLAIVLSIFLAFPVLISIQQQEPWAYTLIYMLTIIIAAGGGTLLHKLFHTQITISISTGMIICALGWILASLIMAIPFYLIMQLSFLDAFFESVSGFTTTGFTVFADLEKLPLSLMFLRSLLQWLGGLGILSFFLLITFRSEGEIWQLFGAEAHKISSARPVPNLYKTIKIFWSIYLFFTIFQAILLLLAGMGLFDAITHSMTTAPTGGFSRYNENIRYFREAGYSNYKLIEYIFIFFMFLGGVNFLLHYKVLQRKWDYLRNDVEFKFYLKLILAFTLLILFSVIFAAGFPENLVELEEKIRNSLFQVVAMLTSSGFETKYIGSQYFMVFAQQLFLAMMLIGGCVGSTSGGFKVLRIIILKRLFGREIRTLALPKKAVNPLTLEQSIVEWKDVYHIAGLFFGWLTIIFIGGLIIALFSSYDIATSFSGMFSALNNIGPSYIPASEVGELHPVIKITYILGMLAGRLEIIPVIALFRPDVWQR